MKLLAIIAFLLATSDTSPPSWKLTPSGWGPAKIGMTRAQVSTALKAKLEGEPIDDEGTCLELVGADDALPGLLFLFEDGKLSRISAIEPSAVATPRGVHVGSTAEEVRKAYGVGIKSEPHHYEDPPAEYLTFWLDPGRRGVRFETDNHGRVDSIHAGTSSIQYVEGCA